LYWRQRNSECTSPLSSFQRLSSRTKIFSSDEGYNGWWGL